MKEVNNERLGEEEVLLKIKLELDCFNDFSKNDFQGVIKCFENFERNDYDSISKYLNKKKDRTKLFVEKVLGNLDLLKDGNRIKKNLEKFEKNKENLKKNRFLLKWKCKNLKNYTEICFSQNFYMKIKSKIYTKLQDKFLIYEAYSLTNSENYGEIKKKLLKERLFQFDFYLQGIRENLLGKRINSLIKMIENEYNNYLSENTNKKKKEIFKKKTNFEKEDKIGNFKIIKKKKDFVVKKKEDKGFFEVKKKILEKFKNKEISIFESLDEQLNRKLL